MAMACANGVRECDGCGRCFEANPYRIIALRAVCDEPVLGCEDRYEFPRCMGVSRAFVQNGIMDGSLDIGVAVRIKKRFAFYIIPGKLRDMVGEDRFTAFFGGGGQNGNNPNR